MTAPYEYMVQDAATGEWYLPSEWAKRLQNGHAPTHQGTVRRIASDVAVDRPAQTLGADVGVRLVQVSTVVPEHVEHVWRDHLYRGKLATVEGDPGLGKSTVLLDIAARISRGLSMPDGTPGIGPADVIIMSAEDGLADTIRPRLDAAAADSTRIHALTATVVEGEERPVVLPEDFDRIEAAIVATGAVLVVVDVLMAYLAGDVNAHRDQDVRRALARASACAERTGACIVFLRHLNKSAGGPAIYRGGGSIGISGAARSVLVVGHDPDDDSRLVLASVKNNLGPMPPAIGYRIVDAGGAGRIEWLGATAHTAAQLLAAPSSGEERTALDDAAAVLRDILEAGPVSAKDVRAEARAAGIADRTLERAKAALAVRSVRPDGFTGPWAWSLPNPVHRQDSVYIATPADGDVRTKLAMYTGMSVGDEMAAIFDPEPAA